MADAVDDEELELPLEMDSDMNHSVSCEPEERESCEQETEDNVYRTNQVATVQSAMMTMVLIISY